MPPFKKNRPQGHERKAIAAKIGPAKDLLHSLKNCRKKSLDEILELVERAKNEDNDHLLKTIYQLKPQIYFKDGRNLHHFSENLSRVFSPIYSQTLSATMTAPSLSPGIIMLHSIADDFEKCDEMFSCPSTKLAKPRLQHDNLWVTNSLIMRTGVTQRECSSWKEMLTPFQYFSLRGFPEVSREKYDEAVNNFDESSARFIVLDCEMVGDEHDHSMLARISVYEIDTSYLPVTAKDQDKELTQPPHKELFDHYCLPERPVVHWRTAYSGITPEIIDEKAKISADELRKLVADEINRVPNTVLIGHSIENDLTILGLHHPLCIDTSVLLSPSLAFKNSLKGLAAELLGRDIQSGVGHDSFEDCYATADLALAIRHNKIPISMVDVEYIHLIKEMNLETFFAGPFSEKIDSFGYKNKNFEIDELLDFVQKSTQNSIEDLITHKNKRFLAVCQIPHDREVVKRIVDEAPPGVLVYYFAGTDPKKRPVPKVPGGMLYCFKAKAFKLEESPKISEIVEQ